MRLAGQMKLGFFPIPAKAVERLTKFVVKSPGDMHTLMDPCCGKGAALKQFSDLLGIHEHQVYGMELDTRRGEAARELLPKAKIVSPSDFPSSKTSFGTISLCWLNPPYDDELGGGKREEARFLLKATDCLVRGGILMFAAPQRVIDGNSDIQRMLLQHYEDILMVPYPEDCRKFREMVVIAKRRKQFVNADDLSWRRCAKAYWGHDDPGEGFTKYVVPAVFDGPKSFEKGSYCDWEVVEKMASSPLKKMFDPPKPRPMPQPGLQLGAGQRALVLAGGFLNRVLTKFGQSILIKATPAKETYIREQNTEEVTDKSGESEIKTTTIYSERIILTVRILDEKGVIHSVR